MDWFTMSSSWHAFMLTLHYNTLILFGYWFISKVISILFMSTSRLSSASLPFCSVSQSVCSMLRLRQSGAMAATYRWNWVQPSLCFAHQLHNNQSVWVLVVTSSVRIIFRNKLPTYLPTYNSFYLGEVKLHIGVVKYPSRPIVGNLISFSLHG